MAPLYELSERNERRVENLLLTLGLGTFLAGVALVWVLPDDLVASVPPEPAVAGATAAFAPVSYLLVRQVRRSEDVTLEGVARGILVVALVVTACVLVTIALVLAGVPVPLVALVGG